MARSGDTNRTYQVLASSKDFLVINKSPGISVHPSESGEKNTLSERLVKAYPELKDIGDPNRPGIVHRIDKDTSGILIVARNQKAFLELQYLFKQREIKKTYLALVFGKPNSKSFNIKTYLKRAEDDPTKIKTSFIEGKTAITEGKLDKTFTVDGETISQLVLYPKTGRMHQLRSQLKAFALPILGDTKYGMKPSKRFSKKLGITRQMLHAYKIEFALKEKEFSFTAEIPQDFKDVLKTLEKEKDE